MNREDVLKPSREEYIQLSTSSVSFDIRTEIVTLKDSVGRVTATDIYSINTLPNQPTSAMDGIAIKFESLLDENIVNTTKWELGKEYIFSNTGVSIPSEYDTAIPIEAVEFDENGKLHIKKLPSCKGDKVNPCGHIINEGDLVIPKGYLITAYQLGILASAGIRELEVIAKPKVAIIPTGDELITAGIPVPPGKNIETNSFVLEALVKEWGGEPIIYPIIPDDFEQLCNVLHQSVESSDIVIFNAGSSKGTHDYTIDVLEKVGKVLAYQVAHGPGRPTSFAVADNKPIIGLVGPPIGTELTAEWYVKPLINKYLGQPTVKSQTLRVKLLNSVSSPVPFDFYAQLEVINRDGEYFGIPLQGDRFSRINLSVKSNAILHIPSEKSFDKGELVTVELKVPKEYIRKEKV